MSSPRTLAAAAAVALATYGVDVPMRRALAARRAREIANRRGLPLLNIGAGTAESALFGGTLYGDYNVDLHGEKGIAHGPDVVTFGDALDLRDFESGSIGAVLASHVLEHVADPAQAVREWRRVTGDPGAVVIVTPSWWAPHTWLHPGHEWYFAGGAGGGEPVKISGSAILGSIAAAAVAATAGHLAARGSAHLRRK